MRCARDAAPSTPRRNGPENPAADFKPTRSNQTTSIQEKREMPSDHDLSEGKCPFRHTVAGAPGNADWWPNQLNVRILRQNSPKSDPMGVEFDYAEEFKSLDLNAVIKDLHALMTTSQEW